MLKKTNLHQRLNYKFDRRTTTVSGVNDTFAADLVDMNSDELSNSGYILNVMDIMSRRVESVKLATKSKSEIEAAFTQIFQRFGTKPRKVWSDKEAGIVSLKGWFASQGIELYHVENSYMGPNTHSVGVIEAFNKKMKNAMMDQQTKSGGNWSQLMSHVVNKFVPEYNQTVHGVIGTTPNEAYNGDFELMAGQDKRNLKKKREPLDKLEVGDLVYLQKPKEIIRGKKENKYYSTVEQVSAVINTNPTTYQLKGHGDTGYYRQQFIRAETEQVEDVADDTDIEDDDVFVPEVEQVPRRSERIAAQKAVVQPEVKAPARRSERLAAQRGDIKQSLANAKMRIHGL